MENPDALAGLGWCLYGMKETQGFDDLVTALSPESRKAAPLQGLLFLYARMAEGRAVSAAADLSQQLDAKPDNYQARFDLALRLLSTHDLEQALTQLITIVRKNRNWNEDKARQLVTDLLAAMGPHHPLTQPFRRQLSSVLFS
jgi:putative thioredoxin